MKISLITFIIFIFSNNQFSFGQAIEIKVKPETTFQTIHNFGASDAWSCQFVGNWPDDERNKIADLLFSLDENEDGSAKGIGLSCWRFNIGGGSADQTTETKIDDRWRQSECFLQSDGSYNWEKQSGQRWFLKAAQKRGVENFLGFVNSPPVWLTKNGRANSDGGNSVNLAEENFSKYSQFLIKITKNIALKDGVLFDYISPINEPQWDWKGGQEGTPWTNSEMAKFCRILGNDISKAGLSSKISIAEAGFLTPLFERGNDSKRGFQIKQFFSPESENYIGGIPNMAHKISGHSYHTVKTDTIMNLIRSKLHDEFQHVDPTLDFWMSEYCILGGNGVLKGGGRDLGMETALFVANIIHADLAVANASAWQWWIAVSKYNFKDGLVYIDEKNHDIFDSKLLWALGNYSRFIRPGAKRIDVEANQDGNLKTSAYKNKNDEIVIVIINKGNTPETVQINLNGKAKRYETSKNNSLALLGKVDVSKPVIIPMECILTFVITQ